MTGIRCLFCIVLAGGALLLTAASDTPPLEDQVLERINEVRQDPAGYADRLRTLRNHFIGNALYAPDHPKGTMTREGLQAIDDAIAFLERQRPLPPLDRGALLDLAAQDHVADQGPRGARGHVSPDGATPADRVRRRGGGDLVGEGISYGYTDAEQVVRQLVVDDGVPDRSHRLLLFNQELRYAGIGCGAHQRYGHMCVIDVSRTRTGRSVFALFAQNDVRGGTKAP
ncbi:CAP domain-containing protein [Sphingomonas sp. HT-1]|uniref:CAP domain-containing protein n=1 Tax=unclassified Sphingomonas TaxID=196159 RepID=UPI0002FA3FFA|nr:MULTISPECIES: CAP domain-containing protein [unclassified Sphingomonas]